MVLRIILSSAPGESKRQIKAIVDAVTESLKKEGVRPLHEEGTADSGWILLDYCTVILHVFASFERDYYQLDKLWEKACTKVRGTVKSSKLKRQKSKLHLKIQKYTLFL